MTVWITVLQRGLIIPHELSASHLVHLFCRSVTLLAMKFVLIFIRKGVVCKALETNLLFMLQLEYQVTFEAPHSRKM